MFLFHVFFFWKVLHLPRGLFCCQFVFSVPNFFSFPQRNFLFLITVMSDSLIWWKLKKKMMNLLEFHFYETLRVKVYLQHDISPQVMVGHLCTNFLSLPQHILFLMSLFSKALESLDTVNTWTSLYKVWTHVVQNIRSFFKLGISRFKVDVPSATQF